MESMKSEVNPFQAPAAPAVPEPILREDDDFLVFARMILCRETVHLPPVCIRYGETENVQPRTEVLRTLTGVTVGRIIFGALLFLGLPLWLAIDNAPFFRSDVLNFICAISLLSAFGGVVWWSAKKGLMSVNVTWYVSERYRRRIRWNKWIVRSLIVLGGATAGTLTSIELGNGWPLFICLAGASVMSFAYEPEIKLQLTGRKKEAFVLRGHYPAFHKAVLAQQTGLWEHQQSGTIAGGVKPDPS